MKTSTQLKVLFLLLTVCVLHASAFAQIKQTRKVGNFEAVSASGAVNIFLRQGNAPTVVVETAEEGQQYLVTEVQGGVLKIYRAKGINWRELLGGGSDKVNVYITSPRLRAVTVSGASSVKGESAWVADELKLQTSGASDMVLSIKAKSLVVNCSGASDVKLSGQADRQQVSVSGGSEYEAYALQSRNAQIGASGASEVEVSVDGELTSNASGASSIRYRGSARVLSSRASGASSVRQAR
ncbi:hypothetical protein SAMN00120144_1248 [Hymenobacter roseosalivarius DSM 11622]|uniref:Putative auto-transporter adhesin head GIN domain-containing protein n=1 Tax=Hymenobacter roseosalivarius DSM 11622 TaxID=645990 RepID=A0A1W1W5V8_9BACT|nr:head GIN domain-containing protein [Hymenobacter roseosalivarius]SMC00494.1 hypothetical protein SAMN00120144_1248 [Hymenobacter roseosalivarius DSM 11622]